MIERMRRPSLPLSVLLVVGGILGLAAAFALTLDKFALAQNPHFVPSCHLSVLVDCTVNLKSAEGSVFGFPNPLIGLVAFPAPIILGVASLAGVRFPRWFWAAFNVGMAFAIGFVIFLMTQSVFHLGTLCPWCMVVWLSVIPMSVATTLYNLREGHLPLSRRVARVAGAVYGWTPLIVLIAYVAFAVVAQVRLDVLHHVA